MDDSKLSMNDMDIGMRFFDSTSAKLNNGKVAQVFRTCVEFENVSPCLDCITFELREGSYKSSESTKVCTDIYRKRTKGDGHCENSMVEEERYCAHCNYHLQVVFPLFALTEEGISSPKMLRYPADRSVK